jgi:membrane-bound ClpP family serine protease
MSDKVVNDMVAFTKGIAARRDRNAEWAKRRSARAFRSPPMKPWS